MTRLAVVYASLGRPDVLLAAVESLQGQILQPDIVVVSSVSPSDTTGLDTVKNPPVMLYGSKGLCAQRNRALQFLDDQYDIVIFFDDDFLPADDYLLNARSLFEEHPDMAGFTGRVVADGIKGAGYTFEEAFAFLRADTPPSPSRLHPTEALYGCNMVIRMAMAHTLRFDENLPLYGWLEDVDFTYQLNRAGRLAYSDVLVGVHLGTKGSRTSGIRFGYSQIANPLYMLRKKSVPPRLAFRMMTRNVASNIIFSFCPEPSVDRIGRLRGNCRAIVDLMMIRLDPRNILSMN